MNYPEILKGRVATYKCSGTIYSKGVYHLRWVWIDTTWSSLEAESDWFGFETLEECIEDHRVHVEKLHAMRHGGTISQLLPLPEGEVAELVELVEWLREEAHYQGSPPEERPSAASRLTRAADLLEQQATAYAICERERLHQSTKAANLEIERHPAPVPVAAKITEKQREAVREAVAEAIGSDAYDCTRVWEAWNVGTMGQDDFVPIVEDDLRIAEIADAAIDELLSPQWQTAPVHPAVEGPTEAELRKLYSATALDVGRDEDDFFLPFVFARAVLAQWGNRPTPPVEGEVAILARWMRDCAESAQRNGYHDAENMHIRIAELLENQFASSPAQVKGKVANAVADLHAIADILSAKERHIQARKLTRAADLLGYLIMEPLPVSQRLPGPDDCDMEGRCWCFTPRIDIEKSLVFHARWILSVISDVDTHWLPYCSLPLPSGEVE